MVPPLLTPHGLSFDDIQDMGLPEIMPGETQMLTFPVYILHPGRYQLEYKVSAKRHLPKGMPGYIIEDLAQEILVIDGAGKSKTPDKAEPAAESASATTSTRSPKYGDDSNSVVDAQAALVMQKGLLDDIIDGIQLGVVTIAIISFLFIAIFAGSLPTVFPLTQPIYDFVYSIPDLVYSIPELVNSIPEYAVMIKEGFPTTLDEALLLASATSAWFAELLHTLPYKESILVLSWATYLWETHLDIRQRDRLHEVRRPQAISSFVSRQAYLEANAYGLDQSSLMLIQKLFDQVTSTIIIAYDLIPMLWAVVGVQMDTYLGFGAEYEITQSLLFVMAACLVSSVISLPFSLYSTFVVEKRHGFNKQTIGIFVSDMLKSYALGALFGGPLVAAFLWIVTKTGSQFYLYAWALMAGAQVLFILIFPTFIQPLFNKFDPLPEGDLRTSIEALASRLNFPLKKLYVVDGSKRSGHSNAYVTGFSNSKKIVVYDTLIEQCATDEIVAIIGHELGHWKKNHLLRMLVAAQAQIFLLFFAFGAFVGEESMYASFGMDTMPTIIGFIFFQYLYEPLSNILQFGINLLSRLHEFDADAFSKKLGFGGALASGLIKIHVENKSNLNPDPLYSAYHYSHPPLVERLNAIWDPNVAPKTE
ncbi:zinc metalloprotease [Coemansia sp. RSA 1933]|nr:zinc metalloprotease [Coemansia sp. RSA 1933]